MSIVERVKQLIEEKADGHHHALMHIAEELENSGGEGLPSTVVERLGEKIDQHMRSIGQEMAAARAAFSERLEAVEAKLAAAEKEREANPGNDAGAATQS